MGAISKILVNDVNGYLPHSMKLDQSVPQSPAISGFSSKAVKIFSDLGYSSTKTLSKSFRDLEKDIGEISRLNKNLIKSKNHEKLHKLVSLIALAAAVSFLAVAITGIVIASMSPFPWFIIFSLATTLIAGIGVGAASLRCHYAFHHVSHLKKRINTFVQADKAGKYDLDVQKYLIYHEESLRNAINNEIEKLKDKVSTFDNSLKLKASIEGDIQDLADALHELDTISNIYNS